jgi:GNAT superfamily N-acetyltransferase
LSNIEIQSFSPEPGHPWAEQAGRLIVGDAVGMPEVLLNQPGFIGSILRIEDLEYFGATHEGAFIGVAAMTTEGGGLAPHTFDLAHLALVPEVRGQGFARPFLALLEQNAAARGARYMSTYTTKPGVAQMLTEKTAYIPIAGHPGAFRKEL